tara:strand:- start:200 stop:535 length:336 start_codon:yes stop_codon:yes gene_type:complete
MHAFDVLGDPVRRRILELLAHGECGAGTLAETVCAEFSISQAAVSQHLKVLRVSGFAVPRKDGPRRIYAIEPDRFREVDDWLDRFRHVWQPKLDALATEVARRKKTRRTQD